MNNSTVVPAPMPDTETPTVKLGTAQLVGNAAVHVVRFQDRDYPFAAISTARMFATRMAAGLDLYADHLASSPSVINAYGVPNSAWEEVAA